MTTIVAVTAFCAGLAVGGAAVGLWFRRRRNTAPDPALAEMVQRVDQLLLRLADVDRRNANDLGQMSEQLRGIADTQRDLTSVTQALRDALASSQARGQWGERLVADVLRAAGFVEGVNYVTQQTLPSGARPDVTFILPEGSVLHLDVKFPFANYLNMLEADSAALEQQYADQFIKDVRIQIRDLSRRGYIDEAAGTLDCVLLFIPNEQIAAAVHQLDPSLFDDALALRVIITSPASLFAVLAALRATIDRAALEATGTEILQALTAFRDQWGRYEEVRERLGRALSTVQRAYDELEGVRSQQLQRQLDRIEELRLRRQIATPEQIAPPEQGE